VITRLVVDKVGNRLGQRFIVENRPGAGGVIGTAEVARAAPDGYTLVVSGLGSMILGPFFNKASFDPVKDFTHIAYFGGGPAALVVSNSSEAKTLTEFVELSRRQASGLSYGTPGRGTLVHLVAEMFRRESGANLVLIQYKDAAHGVNAFRHCVHGKCIRRGSQGSRRLYSADALQGAAGPQ
jgi:tripartite-type tricarboxylate transporter receptor subunit TctC